jgi:nuclear receptor interaction protein
MVQEIRFNISDSLWILQRMSFSHSLDYHRGCVNSVAWNESGSLLLSGSDDHRLIVTEPHTKRVRADILTKHRANIFSAKFLPASCDNRVVSCAGDGSILYTGYSRRACSGLLNVSLPFLFSADVEHSSDTSDCFFNCHSGTTYEVLQVPADPHTFLTCGEDGTVRWFDLRLKEKCNKPACKEVSQHVIMMYTHY